MRSLILAALLLALTACGTLDNCPDGLRDPPAGSVIPAPHG